MDKLAEKIINQVVKESGLFKSAHVFDPGDIIILVDQIQGLNKGAKYKVESIAPGKVTIANLNITDGQECQDIGDTIGEFDADRFVRHNDNY